MKGIIKRRLKQFQLLKTLKHNNAVFLYHHIGEKVNSNIHNISFQRFKAHVERISKIYNLVHVDDLFNASTGKLKAAITFDDAAYSIFNEAIPFLEIKNIPTTIFLNKSLIEGRPFWRDLVICITENNLIDNFKYFSGMHSLSGRFFYQETKDPDKVNQKELVDAMERFFEDKDYLIDRRNIANLKFIKSKTGNNVRIGNHSLNHYLMASLDFTQQFEEISKNKSFIEANFDKSKISSVFAIPFGDKNSFNKITLDAAYKAGYSNILSTESSKYYNSNFNTLTAFDNVKIINRFMPKEKTII